MVLPLILSLLGSGAAGAGLFGAMSPLLAGSIGSGLGAWAETGDLEKGLLAGLGGFAGGSLLGNLMGGASGAALDAGTGTLAAGTPAAIGAPTSLATPIARNAAIVTPPPVSGPGGIGGLFDQFIGMPPGITPVPDPVTTGFGSMFGENAVPWGDVMSGGLNQGIMTGGGVGSAMGGQLAASYLGDGEGDDDEDSEYRPAQPFNREYIAAPEGYQHGIDPEHTFFSGVGLPPPGVEMADYRPEDYSLSRYANPSMMGRTTRLAEGGLADMARQVAPQAPPQQSGPNDKQILQGAVAAIRGDLPEQQATMAVAMFLQTFGEDALRKLVDEVAASGSAGSRDAAGKITGAGNGTDDLVPATIEDSGQDVLLSDGEFVVPAAAVAGLGGGNTDTGAERLTAMSDQARMMPA